MSRKRRSLISALARSSTTEELELHSEIVKELTFYINLALSSGHRNALVTAVKARGFPAQLNMPAKYLRTIEPWSTAHRPAQELVRRIQVWGYYGPATGSDVVVASPSNRRITPLGSCELLADSEMYCHSPALGWELGQLKLYYSDEGWHEPVTTTFLNRAWKDEQGEYHVRLNQTSPEVSNES